MNRATIGRIMWGVLTVLAIAARAQAQVEAGTVAAVQGTLQIDRAHGSQTAGIGTPILVGDRLRTGPNDRAKIVFRDDSVLDLAPGTEMTLDTQVFDPANHRFEALLHLIHGKARAWVSEYYRQARSRYEVETPTAVAGVRGTEFIALYNPTTEVSEFVGLADQVEVSGKLAVMGPSAQVGPEFYTQVKKGRFPTPPQRLDEARLRKVLEGLDIAGTGRRDGLNVMHPSIVGRVVTPQDLPATSTATAEGRAARVTTEGLPVGTPQEFLAQRLSPDVRSNTQPLLDFRRTPPGRIPAGGVKIGF